MIFFRDQYIKIWECELEEKRAKLKISTSEKDKEGNYRNSSWNAVVIGKALNQIKNGEIDTSKGSRAKIAMGKVTNELYTARDGNKKTWLEVVVMDFATDSDNSAPTSSAPAKASTPSKPATKKVATKKVEEASDVISDEDLPF